MITRVHAAVSGGRPPVLDLFIKQARAIDPDERKRHLRAFEKRLLDEEAITPSHFLNQQLDTVWLAE